MNRRSGWFGDSYRHSLARRGIYTSRYKSLKRHPLRTDPSIIDSMDIMKEKIPLSVDISNELYQAGIIDSMVNEVDSVDMRRIRDVAPRDSYLDLVNRKARIIWLKSLTNNEIYELLASEGLSKRDELFLKRELNRRKTGYRVLPIKKQIKRFNENLASDPEYPEFDYQDNEFGGLPL